MRRTIITHDSDEAVKKRALTAIFMTIFVSLIGFGIVIPLMPSYAEHFGASELVIGFLFASFSIAQLFASPVLGDWSDRFGRRPVIIFSLIGSVVSFIMLALAHRAGFVLYGVSGGLLVLFLSRIVDGLSGGNITAARAYIADILDEKDRAKGFGLIGAAFGLGFIVGPALGGLLVKINLQAPAWGAAIISLLATLLAYYWLPETLHTTHAKRPSPWKMLPTLMNRPVLGRLLWINFAVWVGFAIYQMSFPLFARRQFGFSEDQVGYTLALVGAVGVLTQVLLVGRTVSRLGEQSTLMMGLFLCAIGLASAAFTKAISLLIVMVIITTIGGALATPSLTSLLSRAADPREQGLVQGVSGSLESLARIIGPIWGNGIMKYSVSSSYSSAAILLTIVACFLLSLGAKQLTTEAQRTQGKTK
jgi:DHA1 family tetracycline resistance protein-like MFS transporter